MAHENQDKPKTIESVRRIKLTAETIEIGICRIDF